MARLIVLYLKNHGRNDISQRGTAVRSRVSTARSGGVPGRWSEKRSKC